MGDTVKADIFAEGDKVDVTGISKGHGYAGVIKRFGQGRTPTSHGGGPVHRHAGSMGSSTDPSRSRLVTWAWIRSLCRTWTSSRSTQN